MLHNVLANISRLAATAHINTHLSCVCHISMLVRHAWALDTGLVDAVVFGHKQGHDKKHVPSWALGWVHSLGLPLTLIKDPRPGTGQSPGGQGDYHH